MTEFVIWTLIVLLLFSNWLWFVAFTSYRNQILKHVKERDSKGSNPPVIEERNT